MIVVRDVFALHFGKAREAREALLEGRERLRDAGYPVTRVLTDVTGEYYTLVMEASFESLAAYEEALRRATDDDGWREAYARLVPLVRSGHREVMREVA
jgi:hypothetical protein